MRMGLEALNQVRHGFFSPSKSGMDRVFVVRIAEARIVVTPSEARDDEGLQPWTPRVYLRGVRAQCAQIEPEMHQSRKNLSDRLTQMRRPWLATIAAVRIDFDGGARGRELRDDV